MNDLVPAIVGLSLGATILLLVTLVIPVISDWIDMRRYRRGRRNRNRAIDRMLREDSIRRTHDAVSGRINTLILTQPPMNDTYYSSITRAISLFMDILSEDELMEFIVTGRLLLKSHVIKNRWYALYYNPDYPIRLVEGKNPKKIEYFREVCVTASRPVPIGDLLASFYLLYKTDERALVKSVSTIWGGE